MLWVRQLLEVYTVLFHLHVINGQPQGASGAKPPMVHRFLGTKWDLAEEWLVSGKSRQTQKGRGMVGHSGIVISWNHQDSFPLGKRSPRWLETHPRARHLELLVWAPWKLKERRLKRSTVQNDKSKWLPRICCQGAVYCILSGLLVATRWWPGGRKLGNSEKKEVEPLGMRERTAFRIHQLQWKTALSG